MIPVIGADGEVTEVYGRKINDNLRAGTPLHLYLPGPHRGVWNASVSARQRNAGSDLVRSADRCADVLVCRLSQCHGELWGGGLYGRSPGRSSNNAASQRVLIAYDRDEAGERAAEKLAVQLNERGAGCYRILFPKGMDANEYALKVGPAAKSLGVAIRSAQWLGKGQATADHHSAGTSRRRVLSTCRSAAYLSV